MRKISSEPENSIVLTDKLSRDSFFSFIWIFSDKITSVIGSIIIAFYLSTYFYGIYSIINSWGFFLAAICTFGLPDIITKIITENRISRPKKNRNFITTINIISLLIIGIVTVVSVFTSRSFAIGIYGTQIFEVLIYFILIKISFSTIFIINQNVLRGFKEYKNIAIILISCFILKVPFLVVFLINFGIYGIFYVEIIINSAILILMLLKTLDKTKDLEKTKFEFESLEIKTLLKQSLPLFFVIIMNLLLNWLSLTIFSIFTSFTDVSFFQISFNVINLILLISFSINTALLPDITEKYKTNKDDFRLTVEKLIKLNSLLTTIAILFVIFFFPILVQVFYPAYYDLRTFQSAIILVPYIFINSYFLISNQIIITLEKTWLIFIINAIYFVLFIPMLYLLVIFYNVLGLSLTFMIVHLIFFPIYLLFLIKNEIKEFKTVVSLTIINFSIFSVLNFFLYQWIFYNFLIWAIFASIIFSVAIILTILIIQKDENCKAFIKNMLRFIGGIRNRT